MWVGEGGMCVLVRLCVWVCMSAWVRRARDSLDGWCMFCGGVNYASWDGSTYMWVRHF